MDPINSWHRNLDSDTLAAGVVFRPSRKRNVLHVLEAVLELPGTRRASLSFRAVHCSGEVGMSRRVQRVTALIAIGAMLFWSFGVCCCVLGGDCCSNSTMAQATHGAEPVGCCSAKKAGCCSSQAAATEDSSRPAKSKLCGCRSRVKSAIQSVAQPDMDLVESESLLAEPTLVAPISLSLPRVHLSYLSPIHRQRGPPEATGLSRPSV